MLPRLGYLLHCVQRGYLDALSKYVSAVPTFKQYLTLKEGEEKRYVLSVKRKLTVVFQGNSPGIKDIIMNSTTIELSPRLIMTTDGGNDTEPEEGSQEEEDIPEKAVKSSPKKRAANNTGEEDASPKKKRAPAVSNPKLRNMIYGYLLQSTETSISVCVFRKYCPRNPKYFGREGIAEAVIKHFQTPEYDIKSRLHWGLYYAEFRNTVHKDLPKNISPAILRVSSEVHWEAEATLYKSHTFDIRICPTTALAFYQTLPYAAILLIPRVRIDFFHITKRGRLSTKGEDFSRGSNALVKLVAFPSAYS